MIAFENSSIQKNIENEYLTIEVTRQCSSLCAFCFARPRADSESSLTQETALEIIKEGYELGYRTLHVTGGEPFLWNPLIKLMDMALSMGYETIFCNTNGSLLNMSTSKKIARFGTKVKLSVSIMGDTTLHDRMRGRGTRELAAKGIQNALDAGIMINIFSTVGKALLAELPRFSEGLYKEFPGIEGITLIQLFQLTDDVSDLSNQMLSAENFITMVTIASLLNLCGFKVEILENALANVVAGCLHMKWIPFSPPLHRPGRITILSDRSVTISHSSSDFLSMYRQGVLEEVLYSDIYRRLTFPDEDTCPECPYLKLCRPNGMLRPSNFFIDACSERPYCKRVLNICRGSLVQESQQLLS
jgi:MoaA/NifB/PqqE/SkfB family radical SAM enzyme